MGNGRSSESGYPELDTDRNIYVKLISFRRVAGTVLSSVVYTLQVSHRRFTWIIHKRHTDILELDNILLKKYELYLDNVTVPRRRMTLIFRDDPNILQKRGLDIAKYVENLGSRPNIFESLEFREFLEIGMTSLYPELGRKGKAGYLKKVSFTNSILIALIMLRNSALVDMM